MKSLKERRADKEAAKGGWGELHSWPVPRGDDPPLVFQMRLPATMELVDLDDLVASAPGSPADAGDGVGEIASVAGTAGLVVVGALREHKAGQAAEVLATITVAFAQLGTLPDPAELATPTESDVRPPTVERLSDTAIRVDRFTRVLPPGAEEHHPHLLVQYMLQSRFGSLVMAYATTDPGMIFGDGGRDLFFKITETIFIGERPMF